MLKKIVLLGLLVIFGSTIAFATNAGVGVAGRKVDANEAKMVDFVKEAVKYAKANGKDASCKAFSAKQGEPLYDKFHKGELYIYAYDYKCVNVAHGEKAHLIGKDLSDLRSTDGKYIIKDLVEQAKKGAGWLDYTWEHPQKKAIRPKVGYVEKVDDSWWLGSGVYK